ncbi:BZ3500_MvSof-1268-A1-R1_Chr7-2g09508 [Microbotryum saponariae]|uniref:BZ3500_MvSof-1268-A1-R1_Chr7-2g09508 protein n=1 Tax=Microbotryum saponariae TaxID=289078 RepID=A0A2X0MXT9_9BASI|nr:BZ3501_MvSof-1269-A2-R1_Chr7-1g09208 [Microbotryum saponariae]SDA02592.1 BZ3500_MvSof-1268-A1-R1_Chr7-2g09508 [Microbotryum saponariae]
MKLVKLLGAMIARFACACQVHADGCQSAENSGWLQEMIGSDGQDDTTLKNGRADCIKAFDKFDTTKNYADCVSVQCGSCDKWHKWYDLFWLIWGRHLCHNRQKKHCHAVWMDDS